MPSCDPMRKPINMSRTNKQTLFFFSVLVLNYQMSLVCAIKLRDSIGYYEYPGLNNEQLKTSDQHTFVSDGLNIAF